MNTFADVIALWDTATSLASDIGENPVTVRAWRNRNSIPSGKWLRIIAAAKSRGYALTLDMLAKIAERASADTEAA